MELKLILSPYFIAEKLQEELKLVLVKQVILFLIRFEVFIFF